LHSSTTKPAKAPATQPVLPIAEPANA
jgi:hypothetical protein